MKKEKYNLGLVFYVFLYGDDLVWKKFLGIVRYFWGVYNLVERYVSN